MTELMRFRMLFNRRLFKVAAVGLAGLGTLKSLKSNEYDLGAIGIVRLGRAAVSVFLIGRHYQKELYNSNLDRKSQEYADLKSRVHRYGAEQLLALCCANKGVYIKVGQHIGALDYLLPKEYVHTMRVLHSAAPQSSFDDILSVLREDLKKDPYEIFEKIDPEPLGTASLAQVHRAVLKNGDVVAVKIQHKSVKANSYVDIKTMSGLVKLTSIVFPDFKFDWLVDETKKNIPRELDFTQEGKNAEKIQHMFSHYHWLKIPKIYWNLSTPRVLTMEFEQGGQVNDLKYMQSNNINPFEVTAKLGQLYSHMIFIDGFVHSDPHPGNVLVRKKNNQAEIVLLDHGLYADLTDEFRWEYSKLWLAILDGDKQAMQTHCANLGVDNLYGLLACMVSGRTWNTIIAGVRKTKYNTEEKEVFQNEVPNMLPQISEVLERVDRQMLLILKTNDLVRSIEYCLNTHSRMSGMMEMSKCCVKSVYGEKMKHCTEEDWTKWRISLAEQWAIFKLSLYYIYLGILHFDLNNTINALWTDEFYTV